jgi:ATP-dependent DNA helicase RecG
VNTVLVSDMMTAMDSDGGLRVDTPVQYVKGVGPKRAEFFGELGVETAGDLLEYYPRDWQFVPEVGRIGDMKAGEVCCVRGLVESVEFAGWGRKKVFEVMLADESGVCRLIWFGGGYLSGKIECGMVLAVWGAVGEYKYQLQFTNPKFIIVEDDSEEDAFERMGGGVYPATAKLSSGQIKGVIRRVLPAAEEFYEEIYSESFLKDAELCGRADAIRWIHEPGDDGELARAKRRLKYDELFLMQLGLALRRYRARHYSKSCVMKWSERVDSRIRRRFPFLFTEGQNGAIEDMVGDMGKSEPMNRLLQGDVGSGKTVVALYGSLLAVANKCQAAIMAPTEILAGQHFASIERYLAGSEVRRELITGGITGKKRKELLGRIKAGEVDIVVGTVALLQGDIEFPKLGMVTIDEQHKFGVEQRGKLRKHEPHCLVMTATPIPRTLAMTAFGDLDVSVIDHCPPGRGTVVTRWVERKNQGKAEEFIRQRLKIGKQAYFVYPRINDDVNGEVKAATAEWRKLKEEVYPEFCVELLHGQMSGEEKQAKMAAFRAGKVDVLVSTVVIEVGVDVANATMMVIEGAERFGLAQLHQLRGRIGRGESKSFCFLFSDKDNDETRKRLDVMCGSNDGFKIAEEDLRLRGPGEMFSTRQHGLPDLKIANILDDQDLLVMARRRAKAVVEVDAMLVDAENGNLRKLLLAKFGESLFLGDVA